MTTTEFLSEFNLFYDNASNSAPGLTEYEISVFLTTAQDDIILDIYTGNYKDMPFENLEEHRRYLDSLITTYKNSSPVESSDKISENSYIFTLPNDVLFITLELAKQGENNAIVVPTTQDEYYKVSNNPFRGASKKRVLRLDKGDNQVELIAVESPSEYILRYIKRPTPIILIDLDAGDSINGISKETQCTLPESLHRLIVKRAVELAIASQYRRVTQQ